MGKPSVDPQLQAAMASEANQVASSGATAAKEGTELFNLALPGLNQATAYYAKLAGGDPNALARENAPAIQQITGQSNEQLSNIMQNSPRGGARDLAISEADLATRAKISDLTTKSYTSAFPSLASLGGQNVGQGNQATSTGIQGMNAAANQYGNIQQLQNEAKATGLGAMSGGLGDIAMFAAM